MGESAAASIIQSPCMELGVNMSSSSSSTKDTIRRSSEEWGTSATESLPASVVYGFYRIPNLLESAR